jgi:hypothetical protein
LEALHSGRFPRARVFDEIERIIAETSVEAAKELRREMGLSDTVTVSNAADNSEWERLGKDIARVVRSGRLSQKDLASWFKSLGRPASWAREYYEWAMSVSPQKYGSLGAADGYSGIDVSRLGSLMKQPQRVVKEAVAITVGGKRITYTARMVHRYNLSGAVWKSVESAQAEIFDVIDCGRAMGRDGVDIAKGLEVFTTASDGGRRVKGRWGDLVPDKELEKRTTKIMEERGDNQWDMAAHKAARAEARKQLKAEGWVVSEEARRYYKRLGAEGADYRALRIQRTETQFMLRDEAKRDAEAAGYGIKWTLGWERECHICEDLSKGIVAGKQVGTKDGVYTPDKLPEIPHPNCRCIPQPVKII